MSLEDRCSRCGDVVMYCDCPYTDADWFGPKGQIFCVHCSAKAGDCDCSEDESGPEISPLSPEDEGFTRSGPSGYEANTAYPDSFYGGSWLEGDQR